MLGGLATAVLAVLFGSLVRPLLPHPAGQIAVVAVAVFVLAGELGLHRVLLPHRRQQVPTGVIAAGSDAGALQFGFEMGTGMRTHMPSNLPYLPLVAVLLLATMPVAVAAGAGFALGRAWMALGRYALRDPDAWDRQWLRYGRSIRIGLSLAAIALTGTVLWG